MKKIFFLVVTLAICFVLAEHSWAYEFKVDNPKIKISIPKFPNINMNPHPMRSAQPHLLYAGASDTYTITILAPTADAGMTAEECANSCAKSKISQYSLKDSQYAIYKMNDTTILFEYLITTSSFKQVNAHLLSSYKGTHCIDIHISCVYNSDKDVDELHKSFEGASITAY